MIERTDSQQTTCNATALINGERRQVASATCSIRPGQSMTLSVDIIADAVKDMGAADMASIRDMFGEYLDAELEKARGFGIPV